jgi:hypothetical protein
VQILRFWALAALTLSLAPAAFGQIAQTISNVHPFPEGADIVGSSSTLVRNASGITGTFHTGGLQPGAAYTLWILVFNQPENCSDGVCGLNDAVPFPGNPNAGVSLLYASGHIIGPNGKGNFSVNLKVGDASAAHFGNGLLDPWKAEVHLITRTHGQPIPGMIDEQISSFTGGCAINACANDQASAHLPTVDAVSQRLDQLQAANAETNGLIRALGLRLRLGRLTPIE